VAKTTKIPKNKLSANMWVVASIMIGLAMVPNGTAVRLLSSTLSASSLAAIRYSIVSIILIAIFIIMYKKHRKVVKKNFLKILLSAIPFSVGGIIYISAIAESSASYVAILLLLTPIIFGIMSAIFTKDKISKNAVIGILFAILGGTAVILLPVLMNSSVGYFGLVPILLIGVYILLHAAFPVVLRRENETGVPIVMVMAIQYTVGTIVCIIWAATTVGGGVFTEMASMSGTDWLLMAYLSVGFCVILRQLSIKAYEKTGTSTSVAVNYFGQVLAVAFPVIMIGETISPELAVGMALIIIGIVITRKHHIKHLEKHRK
jgi:drug/metabolite transporter (DMT)-like permease